MLSQLINRPCTITRRTSSDDVDAYGDAVTGVETVETVCELQQRQRTEFDDAEVSDTSWLMLFPAGTLVDTGDVVTVTDTGEDFEMVGDPWHVRNPRTQAESHVEATVKRVAGDFDGDGS